MRFDGTLIKWNAQRGFGFIAPKQGGQELFVHISAFPGGYREPAVGEALSFEIELDRDGKKRAFRVQRPGQALPQRSRAPEHVRQPRGVATGKSKFLRTIVIAGLVVAIAWFAISRSSRQWLPNPIAPFVSQTEPTRTTPAAAPPSNFRCDGRKHCSQMTSCAEAKFFLKNCPDPQMDGNHDGVPCEQQWCTSPFAN